MGWNPDLLSDKQLKRVKEADLRSTFYPSPEQDAERRERLRDGVVLPVKLVSPNKKRHHMALHRDRKEFERLLVSLNLTLLPADFKQYLQVVRVLARRQKPMDDTNRAGSVKQLEDAMRACGWFHDDSPRWLLTRVFDFSPRVREVLPCVRVRLLPFEERHVALEEAL